jgi:hypothetical protein
MRRLTNSLTVRCTPVLLPSYYVIHPPGVQVCTGGEPMLAQLVQKGLGPRASA